MLRDVLEIVYQSDPVVDIRQRIRSDSVLQQRNVDMQECERENRVGERNVRDEALENACAARHKGNE